jgi:hypothetical protein
LLITSLDLCAGLRFVLDCRCILGGFGSGCKVEGAGGNSRSEAGCVEEGERVRSDAAQFENRGNSMARFDVPDYSTIHGLMNCIIALIVGIVKENSGVWKIAGEEPCSGEGACCLEAVCLSDLKHAIILSFIIRECFFVLISCSLGRQI